MNSNLLTIGPICKRIGAGMILKAAITTHDSHDLSGVDIYDADDWGGWLTNFDYRGSISAGV